MAKIKTKLTTTEFNSLADQVAKSDLFTSQDGHFILTADTVDSIEVANVHGLRTALQKERTNVAERDKLLKAHDGNDPAALTKMTEERDALKKQLDGALKDGKGADAAKLEQQHSVRLKELTEAHSKEGETWKTREGSLLGEISRLLIDADSAVIMAEKDVEGSPTLLLPHIHTQAKVVEKDGKFRAIVVDPATGGARVSQTKSDGSDMDLRELILGMKKQDTFAPAFNGTNARGSGGSGGAGSGSSSGDKDHQISAEDAMDPGKYRAAQEAAQKAGSSLEIVGLPPDMGGA